MLSTASSMPTAGTSTPLVGWSMAGVVDAVTDPHDTSASTPVQVHPYGHGAWHGKRLVRSRRNVACRRREHLTFYWPFAGIFRVFWGKSGHRELHVSCQCSLPTTPCCQTPVQTGFCGRVWSWVARGRRRGYMNSAALLHQHCRNGQAVHQWAEAIITLAIKQAVPYWLTLGTMYHGLGPGGARPDGGRHRTDTAGSCHAPAAFAAELYRIQGDFLLQMGSRHQEGDAEASLLKALAMAQHQRARAYELRTALSLGRLRESRVSRVQTAPSRSAVVT